MKYKVGDKVKIRKGSLAGNIYTISHIESCGHIELSDLPYVFFDYELEPVDTDGGKIAYDPNGAPLFWMPEPEKPISIELPEFVFDKKQAEKLAEEIKKRLANSDIRLKEEKKMSTKFTFYVTEGTRVDKSCNGTIPTMTTTVTNGLDEVSVTCDKVDFNERQGVLEGIAQLYCKGRFDKEYEAAVKINKRSDKVNRTCIYCGKIFDTAEERVEHEKWHVERKKARRERYLLRKRAKEIAFEEQAQKMAKEMMGEQK